MNAAMEAMCLMWIQTVLTLVALTTAPEREATLGMEDVAKVHVVTFITIIECGFFETRTFLLVPFNVEITGWCAKKSRGWTLMLKFWVLLLYLLEIEPQENILARISNSLNFKK